MSKASDRLLQQMLEQLQAQFAATQKAAQTESPYLHQLGVDSTQFLNQIDGTNAPKDYRNLTPGTFWHMTSLGDRSKQRDQMLGAGATGDAALAMGNMGSGGGGSADSARSPNFLDLDKQNRNAEFENNYAREFQNTVQQQTANAKNTQLGLGEMEQARKSGVAANFGNLFSTAVNAGNSQQPPMWQSLVAGGLQALPGIISGLGGMGGGGMNESPHAPSGAAYGGGGGMSGGTGYGVPRSPYGQSSYGNNPYSTVRTYSNSGGGFGGYV